MCSFRDAGAETDLRHQIHRAVKFYEPILQDHYDNAAQRLDDLKQLETLAAGFPDRATLLADLTLDPPTSTADLPEGQERGDSLVLSTMHSAKGLEWRVVYVLHATDGKIPSEYCVWDPDKLEEERRLFYVALTRAADWLYVCHPQRESSSFGQGGGFWGDNVYERRELTRFVSKAVKSAFDCQDARTFQAPEAEAQPRSKPGRKTRKEVTSSKRRSR
jgi:DNA helicase-2/ATP-dependent DNA helicase PcrA